MTPLPGRWRLLAPAAGLFAADVALTVLGQPTAFHSGEFSAAVEANPVARRVLVHGPEWFAAAAGAWAAVWAAAVLFWRHPLGAWTGIAVAVGHAVGGATWVVRFAGWLPAVAYLAAAAWACGRVWPPWVR